MKAINQTFTRFANKASDLAGSSWAFLLAVVIIAAWAISGPLFGFSDTWQLIINTFTTLVTFLMVFLIQNTQNRDSKALHLKLDEIIHVIGPAHDELIDVEDLTDAELHEMIKRYRQLAHHKHSSNEHEDGSPAPWAGHVSEAGGSTGGPAGTQDGGELVLAGSVEPDLSRRNGNA
jgi:low affinity Fe/Cu permease